MVKHLYFLIEFPPDRGIYSSLFNVISPDRGIYSTLFNVISPRYLLSLDTAQFKYKETSEQFIKYRILYFLIMDRMLQILSFLN